MNCLLLFISTLFGADTFALFCRRWCLCGTLSGKLADLEGKNAALEKQLQELTYQLQDDQRQYEVGGAPAHLSTFLTGKHNDESTQASTSRGRLLRTCPYPFKLTRTMICCFGTRRDLLRFDTSKDHSKTKDFLRFVLLLPKQQIIVQDSF